jgi:hypothetical protein
LIFHNAETSALKQQSCRQFPLVAGYQWQNVELH